MLVRTDENDKRLAFSRTWHILGPFQIGTREATWGADPLEHYGGFCNLGVDSRVTFNSSLAPNGKVFWSQQHARNVDPGEKTLDFPAFDAVASTLHVSFPNIDWPSLQLVYGWSAIQWQAWTRGILTCRGRASITVCLYIENVLEYWLDDKQFFGGDYYAYCRQPLILHLVPGDHVLNVRLVRDIRLFGGVGRPDLSVNLTAAIVDETLLIHSQRCIFPETVGGRPAGKYGSLQVTNATRSIVEVHSVAWQELLGPHTHDRSCLSIDMHQKSPVVLFPGQSRPIVLRICFKGRSLSGFAISVRYSISSNHESIQSRTLDVHMNERDMYEPHRITFLHPSGIVSYSILRPPSRNAQSKFGNVKRMPIMLALHGAGVDVDSAMARHALDGSPDIPAWLLMPSGVTTWSGDDWHTWGTADIEAAIESLSTWINLSAWDGASPDNDRWLVLGHSNGGQGVWYLLTHRPDKIIGAATVSGYSSIQGYVPYNMWTESDPRVDLCVQNALRCARHELLLSNSSGIPVLLQHGGSDSNVPVFHSRRMNQLISQTNSPSFTQYIELEGKDHWFDGVLTTPPLQKFYEDTLRESSALDLPPCFSIVVPNPVDIGPKAGVKVDLLKTPDRLGIVNVKRVLVGSTWTLDTQNITRFHFVSGKHDEVLPTNLLIDGQGFQRLSHAALFSRSFVKCEDQSWKMLSRHSYGVNEGQGYQMGPLTAILHTSGYFTVRPCSTDCISHCLQVSRNLFQYYAADVNIMVDWDDLPEAAGNIITIALGRNPTLINQGISPVIITDSQLIIERSGDCQRAINLEPGMGAVYLCPASGRRLELVIWGLDQAGLRQAARLLPLLTGVGQPELIIVSKRCAWQGAAGVFSMGSLTHSWELSDTSYVS